MRGTSRVVALFCLLLALILAGAPYFDLIHGGHVSAAPPNQAQSPCSSSEAPARVWIYEVLYDPPQSGNDARHEWVELYNAGTAPIALSGWRLRDNHGEDVLPEIVLGPGQVLVVVADQEAFLSDFPEVQAMTWPVADGTIGNGLSNSGDSVALFDAEGRCVDAVSYGDDETWLSPAVPDVEPGFSIERMAPVDTDLAADWGAQPAPTPGMVTLQPSPIPPSDPSPTPTATPTPTEVPTPASTPAPAGWPSLLIHEVFPDPEPSGDDARWEWVELMNPSDQAVDLAGWQLADNAAVDPLPALVLQPGGVLVVVADEEAFRSQYGEVPGTVSPVADGRLGNGLANSGDRLCLLAPDGSPIDCMAYGQDTAIWPSPPPAPGPGRSLERQPPGQDTDSAADWAVNDHPSPGVLGMRLPPPTAIPVPGATESTLVRLNEVLPKPVSIDWNGDGDVNVGDEWIEIYNGGGTPVDLIGWSLDDRPGQGSSPYLFTTHTVIPPGGFLVVYHAETGLALNDGGDDVCLSDPLGQPVDCMTYTDAAPDRSWARSEDGLGSWGVDQTPTPGASNLHVSEELVVQCGSVRLNEVLPAPREVDWDGDGLADYEDEWIELVNLSADPIPLAGWRLDDQPEGGSPPYAFPDHAIISPTGFYLVFRRDSGLALNNDADQVLLLCPDGTVADQVAWERLPGLDQTLGRWPDGDGPWTEALIPSPGGPNQVQPRDGDVRSDGREAGTAAVSPTLEPTSTPTPPPSPEPLLSIAQAKRQPLETFVQIAGQVIAPPGALGKDMYIQDASGGIRIYFGDGSWPELSPGQWVTISGWLKLYDGEFEVKPARRRGVEPGPLAERPRPALLRADQIRDVHVGMLAMVAGRATGFAGQDFFLDDGRGRVLIDVGQGWQRPWMDEGSWWTVTGIVGLCSNGDGQGGCYRLQPPSAQDLAPLPEHLPVFASHISDGG